MIGGMGETERSKVRKALFDLFAEWETQISADCGTLRYAPLADKADQFIDALAGYVEFRRTADSSAWTAQKRRDADNTQKFHSGVHPAQDIGPNDLANPAHHVVGCGPGDGRAGHIWQSGRCVAIGHDESELDKQDRLWAEADARWSDPSYTGKDIDKAQREDQECKSSSSDGRSSSGDFSSTEHLTGGE